MEYESVIILKPKLSEESKNEIIRKIDDCFKEQFKIKSKEDLGDKKLAYEIREYKEGNYLIYVLEKTSDKCDTNIISSYFTTLEEIFKFIIIKREVMTNE